MFTTQCTRMKTSQDIVKHSLVHYKTSPSSRTDTCLSGLAVVWGVCVRCFTDIIIVRLLLEF